MYFKETLSRNLSKYFSFSATLFVTSTILVACSSSTTKDQDLVIPENAQASDFYIVDCLLPGQVRRLGAMTYLAPRRPIKTTAVDCRIRGGEYVAYDRANYRSALDVWLPKAEGGDAEAQTYVGEIFEKGLGATPDYVSAAQWYQRAAEQGFARAQINLGYFYEQGLGVEKNVAVALNLYRQASGLTNDQLVYSSEAEKAIEDVRSELAGKLDSAVQQASVLKGQIASLQKERATLIAKQQQSAETDEQLLLAKREIEVLTTLYERAEEERQNLESEMQALPVLAFREPQTAPVLEPLKLNDSEPNKFDSIEFGRYFALIIGNQDYWYLEDLRSPLYDAKRLQEVLDNQYGFSTALLTDASEKAILNALNDLYNKMGPNDNLLIYYAGHGQLTASETSHHLRGYWLPVDAETDRLTNWISNTVISDHLDRLKARSILVIADSCYAGNMASEKSPFLLGSVNTTLTDEAINTGLARRSRLVISSGGVKPVLDGAADQHSVFAGSLIDILENNNEVLRDNMLFSRLTVNMRRRGEGQPITYTPEMRPIRAAGHGGGDFYFVPTAHKVSQGIQALPTMLASE